ADPADAGSLVNLGLAKSALGDDAGAADAYRKALTVNPNLPQPRLDLGIALYKTGDEDGSKEALANYLATSPKGETAERVRKFLSAIGWKPPAPSPSGGEPVTETSTSKGGS